MYPVELHIITNRQAVGDFVFFADLSIFWKAGMNIKYLYYGFGGFIGFVCGVIISLLIWSVEKSGNPILTNLGRNYGLFGRYLLELFNALPFFGIAIGIVMVRIMFQNRFEEDEH